MSRLLLPALAALVALPVAAQSVSAHHGGNPSTAAAAAVDPAVVGQWEMIEVESEGVLTALETDVEEMTCHFGADGEAMASMTVTQDAETYTRERAFRFVTTDGRIDAEGDADARYEVVGTDELRLTMADGFAVRLRRTDG